MTKGALLLLCLSALPACAAARGETPQNVLWVTIDDCGPDFGCYGSEVVQTPNLDRFAAQGRRFDRCFAATPVCSPSRSALITGCYPTSIGSQHHRSSNPLPVGIESLPSILRRAGLRPTYLPKTRVSPEEFANGIRSTDRIPHVTAVNKADYNFARGGDPLFAAWDSERADQPWFACIDYNAPKNTQGTALAQRWAEAAGSAVDPSTLSLPPYWADVPEVRAEYARYYAGIALLDAEFGALLHWLEHQGFAENTLVIVVGDHGLAMLRHKQWCYDGGLHVPLLMRGPGITTGLEDGLVSTIDLAATTLAALDLPQPAWMEGVSVLESSPRRELFASRDRCDETEDTVRAIRDHRYKLIHNLRPEIGYVGRNEYTRTYFPSVRALLDMREKGLLRDEQRAFLADRKPEWELYDLAADPWELHNRIDDPDCAATLRRLRRMLLDWEQDPRRRAATQREPLDRIVPARVRSQVARDRNADHGR